MKEVQKAKARAEGKDYKHYVVLAHLGVDTTTPVVAQFPPWLALYLKITRCEREAL